MKTQLGTTSLTDSYKTQLRHLATSRASSRLIQQDPLLWGPEHRSAASWLGWVDQPLKYKDIKEEVISYSYLMEGKENLILAGMGGSSLGPEVMGVRIMDSSHPLTLSTADPRTALYVVSSKSGGTIETDAHLQLILEKLDKAGLPVEDHLLVVTDPGSALHERALLQDWPHLLGEPSIGGRFSVLSIFGIAPTILAGLGEVSTQVAIDALLAYHKVEANPSSNPAMELAALLAAAHEAGRYQVYLAVEEELGSLGAWVQQLLAESTGKGGKGLLPMVVTLPEALALRGEHGVVIELGSEEVPVQGDFRLTAPLGAQFYYWEAAVALLGRLLGINPFDQPHVELTKAAAREYLAGQTPEQPSRLGAGWELYGETKGSNLTEILVNFLGQVADDGYAALHSYLPSEFGLPKVTTPDGKPLVVEVGPRFLHSTGQYHKGGQLRGVFLQVTGLLPETPVAVPERGYALQELIQAQAQGDGQVLAVLGCPVMRLHLTSLEGLTALRAALTA